jgi:lactate dehydrogenase-like 2-hydroxyacid dehydrogenase
LWGCFVIALQHIATTSAALCHPFVALQGIGMNDWDYPAARTQGVQAGHCITPYTIASQHIAPTTYAPLCHHFVPLQGIGMNVMAYDIAKSPAVEQMGVPYMSIEDMLPIADVVSLHVPLLPSTYHIMNKPRCVVGGCLKI